MTEEDCINYISKGKINSIDILQKQQELLNEVDFLAKRKVNEDGLKKY